MILIDCYYLCENLINLVLQESSVKECSTDLCVGPIHLLGTCPSPVRRTYRGLVRVMLWFTTSLQKQLMYEVTKRQFLKKLRCECWMLKIGYCTALLALKVE